ncbi:MAG: DUF389 domain-containing protein [Muribaculaceae bacterium]
MLKRLVSNYFTLTGYTVAQEEIDAEVKRGVSFRGTNIVVLIFAIFIASLGLNTNSTAVIIGAMLISPLMGPIIGIGFGLGVQNFRLVHSSARNLAIAAGISVAASTAFFMISPVGEGHSELLARTSPTIYDVLIAFFGGGAGIVGIASRSKGNVLPGVAIATALMPPLCTAGFGLATLQMQYFFGALYLFVINSIFIALATFIGVKAMKYTPIAVVDAAWNRRVRRIIYTIVALTILPSIYLTYNMISMNRFKLAADRFVTQEFRFPATYVLSKNATKNDGERRIDVTLIGRILPADSLHVAMSSRLQYYGLEGVKLNIVQGESPVFSGPTQTTTATDIYRIAQEALAERQHVVDSLEARLATTSRNDTISLQLSREVRALFPQVASIAVSRSVFGSSGSVRSDTVNVALLRYAGALDGMGRQRLRDFLAARLKEPDIVLIDVTKDITLDHDAQDDNGVTPKEPQP